MITETPHANNSILELAFGSGGVVFAVLIILILLSVFSWMITIYKYLQLKKAKKESEEFSKIFWESRNFSRIDDSSNKLNASPVAKLFSSGYKELSFILSEESEGEKAVDTKLGMIEMAIQRESRFQALSLEYGNTFLATVASGAPFIGLFGTVWGIMNAFQGLSTTGTTTLQAVAPGISEALIATAIGLAAAIPAAVAFNYFTVSIRRFKEQMQSFKFEFLSIAKHYLIK